MEAFDSLLILSFHLPEKRTVRGQLASAAKVVLLAGDQVPGQAAARVEVGGIRLAVRVDRHQHPFGLRFALKNELEIGEEYIPIATFLKGRAASPGGG